MNKPIAQTMTTDNNDTKCFANCICHTFYLPCCLFGLCCRREYNSCIEKQSSCCVAYIKPLEMRTQEEQKLIDDCVSTLCPCISCFKGCQNICRLCCYNFKYEKAEIR